ncbi:MAG: hypothetical protein J6K28_05000 [Alistipes sp.]|nr:hypothetical protein [Alistipes sp.]
MKRLFLSAILLAAFPAVLLAQGTETVQGAEAQFAQEAPSKQKTRLVQNATPVQGTSLTQDALPAARKRTPFVRQHELRLTAGAYPVIPFINWTCCGEDYFYDMNYDSTYRGAEYTCGAWSLSYDYRFKKWFDLGLVFSYYGIYSKSYDADNGAFVARNRAHYLTVMPMVRFTWLNREWVRMYSSVGLGATFGFGRRDYDNGPFDDSIFAFQLTPIGIAVGRSFFGFAEVGVGAQGALMIGVGYKFKPKNGSLR